MDRKITGLSVLGFQFSDDGQSVGQSISRGTKKPFGFAQGEQRDKVIEEIEELKTDKPKTGELNSDNGQRKTDD